MTTSATVALPGAESTDQTVDENVARPSPAPASALAPASEGSVFAAFDSVARAARQVALYGPLHPIAEGSLAQACRELTDAARYAVGDEAAGRVLLIRARAEGLVWNDTPLRLTEGVRAANAGRFYSAMRDRLMSCIEIRPGVTPRDLARLLMIMAQDPAEVTADGGAMAALGPTPSIVIHEFDFTAEMLVPEATWRQLCEGVEEAEATNLRHLITSCAQRLPSDPTDAAGVTPGGSLLLPGELDPQRGTVEEVVASGIAQLIQRAGETLYFTNESDWSRWRDEAARQLMALPPRWRSLIFRSPSGYSPEYPDMLGLIAGEMETSDCVALVLDHSDSIQAERSDMLRLALERILAAPDRREELQSALRERALETGVSEAVYENVVGLIVSRIEGRQPSEREAATLRPTMAVSDRPAEAAKQDISDLLRTTGPEPVRRSRLWLLQEAVQGHLTISQYGAVISLLTKAADECARRSDLDGLIDVLGTLAAEAARDSAQDASRRAVASSALARAATEQSVECLALGLEGASAKEAQQLVSLLGVLGEPGVRRLIETIRVGEDSLVSPAMATVLEVDGPDYSHLRDFVSRATGITLVRALRSLVRVMEPDEAQAIRSALHEAPDDARRAVVSLIAETNRADLDRLLIDGLSDISSAVQLAAIDAIDAMKVAQAAPALRLLIEREGNYGEGARVKEAAVRALGELGDVSAVPALCEILRGQTLLAKLGSFRLRVAAAEALASVGGSESLEALRRAARSMHPAVREASRRALARLLGGSRVAAEVEARG